MLVYGYKGKKCPTSTIYWNSQKNLIALNNYNSDLCNNCGSWENQAKLLRHVYLSYSTLCKFNNALVDTKIVDDYFITSINFVKNYLDDNIDILASIDNKCRSIYDNLSTWYKRLVSNWTDKINVDRKKLSAFFVIINLEEKYGKNKKRTK